MTNANPKQKKSKRLSLVSWGFKCHALRRASVKVLITINFSQALRQFPSPFLSKPHSMTMYVFSELRLANAYNHNTENLLTLG